MAGELMQRVGGGVRLGTLVFGVVIFLAFGVTEMTHHQIFEGVFALLIAGLLVVSVRSLLGKGSKK